MSDPTTNSCRQVPPKTLEEITQAYNTPIKMRSQSKAQEAMTCYRETNPLPAWITQPANNMVVGHSSCLTLEGYMAAHTQDIARMEATSNLLENACGTTVSGSPSTTTTSVTTSVKGSVRFSPLSDLSLTTRCLQPNSATLGVQLYMSVSSDKIVCDG